MPYSQIIDSPVPKGKGQWRYGGENGDHQFWWRPADDEPWQSVTHTKTDELVAKYPTLAALQQEIG